MRRACFLISHVNFFRMKSPLIKVTPVKNDDVRREPKNKPKSKLVGSRKLSGIFKRNGNDTQVKLTVSDPLITPSPRKSPRLAKFQLEKECSLSPLLNSSLFCAPNEVSGRNRAVDRGRVPVANYMRSMKPFPRNESNRRAKIIVRTGIRDLNYLAEELNSKATITNSLACGLRSPNKSRIQQSTSSIEILKLEQDVKRKANMAEPSKSLKQSASCSSLRLPFMSSVKNTDNNQNKTRVADVEQKNSKNRRRLTRNSDFHPLNEDSENELISAFDSDDCKKSKEGGGAIGKRCTLERRKTMPRKIFGVLFENKN